jgi:hypothetical protein
MAMVFCPHSPSAGSKYRMRALSVSWASMTLICCSK